MLLMLAAGLVALRLLGLVLTHGHRLLRPAQAIVGLALILSAALLLLYAIGPDTYYTTGVSRWEHASRWGKTPLVAVSTGVAAAASAGLLVSVAAPRMGLLRLLAAPAAVASSLLLLVGWFFLTAGH